MVHARVYAFGDMLDIPDLRALAHRKFRETIECQSWPPSDFMVAALEVIRSTPINGSVPTQMFTENVLSANPTGHELGSGSWEALLKEDIDSSWHVVTFMALEHRDTMDAIKSELRNLIRAMDRETCKYCGDNFLPLLEEKEDADPPLGLALKCKECRNVYETDPDV